jgi:hypothetical protein
VPAFLTELDELFSERGSTTGLWQAGIGDGRIRVMDRLVTENSHHLRSLRRLAKNFGRTLIVEHSRSEMQDQTTTTEASNGAYDIMQRIKQQLDPDNIFPSLGFAPRVANSDCDA